MLALHDELLAGASLPEGLGAAQRHARGVADPAAFVTATAFVAFGAE